MYLMLNVKFSAVLKALFCSIMSLIKLLFTSVCAELSIVDQKHTNLAALDQSHSSFAISGHFVFKLVFSLIQPPKTKVTYVYPVYAHIQNL